MKAKLTLILWLLAALALPSIQSDIDAARNGGVVTLPAGTVTLDAPLVVPAGARNLVIQGAPEGTTLQPRTHFDRQAIQVGIRPELSNNWWITGKNNISVLPAITGEDYVIASQPVTPGYYVLWDEYKIVCAKGPNVSMNHAELVKVTAYDPATQRASLGQRIGREYGGNVWLAPYEAATCQNITIRNLAWRGAPVDGSSMSEGFVCVGITDGATLQNLTATGFRSDCVMTNTSRNVVMSNIQVSGASEGDAGGGYGVSIYRSRFVTVTDSRATGCRHSYILHSGSLDVTLRRCYSANGFDTHGYDERRVAFLDCTGDGGDVGNDAWLGGGQDFLFQRCQFTQPLGFHANVRNVRVVDSTLGGVAIYSVETPTEFPAVPSDGYPSGLRFDRTKITGTLTTQGAHRCGQVQFTACTWTGYSTLIDLANSPTTGTFLFSQVAFSNGPDTVLQLRNQVQGFRFALDRCTFATGARTCIWVAPSFLGSALVTNCTYPAGKTFLADQSAGHVQARGNVVAGTVAK